MPIYTYRCSTCRKSSERMASFEERDCPQVCRSCSSTMEREVSSPKVITFRPGWYEHVGPEPVYCETPQELQDACNKHGGISMYLENSSFKVHRNYDRYEESRQRAIEERKRRDRNIEDV